ncbi:hypothetical protein IAR55_000474 [Kwoniella newhampshirensis]|uniref:Uncharacterized protein n=1 Tax=Kwoniella newhampshirensis TaxID=1651941 RepID=A0AAW0Z705_9TREE
MSQPIATQPQTQMQFKTHRSLSKSSDRPSPHLLTPSGTPPACDPATESRLHQLLAHFDAGTHQFCHEDRETPDERRMSVGSASDVFPTPPSSRRPSFLSSLSLSRPFSFTPSTPPTPLSASHPAGLGMTPSGPNESPKRPTKPEGVQSSPAIPSSELTNSFSLENAIDEPSSGPHTTMTRSKTVSHMQQPLTALPIKQNGFVLSKLGDGHREFNPRGHGPVGRKSFGAEDGKRHFDPSRDPKLLGLL